MLFPGADRDRYPNRDEVVTYLTTYADRLLEWQRSLSSTSLHGVGRDTERVVRRLAAHLTRRRRTSHTGLTCVNIDVCRMPRCCRCSSPSTVG